MKSGQRIETWEGINTLYKEQLKPETACMHRKGLAKTDLLKETITIHIENAITIGNNLQTARPEQSAISTSSIIVDLISMRKKQAENSLSFTETLDLTSQDRYTGVREKLSTCFDRECMDGIL